jgi:hypothetical protein
MAANNLSSLKIKAEEKDAISKLENGEDQENSLFEFIESNCFEEELEKLEGIENSKRKSKVVKESVVDDIKVEEVPLKEEKIEVAPIKAEKPKVSKKSCKKAKEPCKAEKECKKVKKCPRIAKDKVQAVKGIEQYKEEVAKKIRRIVRHQLSKLKDKVISEAINSSNQMIDSQYSQISKINKQEVKANNAVHANVICDGCNVGPIIGSRFKCSICKDFDFCEICEANNFSHNHPFIKIRKPELAPTQIAVVINENNCFNDIDSFEKMNNKFNYYINKGIENFQMNYNKLEKNFKEFVHCFNVNKNEKPNLDILSSQCINDNLELSALNNNRKIKKVIKLRNNGMVNWPYRCSLTCLKNESAIFASNVVIRQLVNVNEEISLEVEFDLTNKPDGIYKSVLQLQTSKKECFGEKITVTINKTSDNALEIKEQYVNKKPEEINVEAKPLNTKAFFDKFIRPKIKKPEIVQPVIEEPKSGFDFYLGLLEEIKKREEVQDFDEDELLNALIKTGGNIEATITNLKHPQYKKLTGKY